MNDEPSGMPSDITRQTVLVVDDNPENLNVLGGLLQPEFRVRVANSGARALEVADSAPQPDIILLDVMMPGMDGYTVLAHLRQRERTAHIPVIFVTALDSSEDEEKGLALGAVDYISKPVRPALVLARVRAQLELKRSRDWLRDQNRLLEARVARRIRENQIIQEVSILALANLAEARDPETGNHIRRTQAYVDILARKLAEDPRYATVLTPRYLDLLAMAAPLHDIGKVGIPDYILLKPGRLTPEEFDAMKQHCTIGADAIAMAMKSAYARAQWWPDHPPEAGALEEAPLQFLEVAREIALYHHEKWDGQGYPEGLAGEAIPLPARLMAIADVFDALVSWRIYKHPVSFEDAVRIIVDSRGSHFDPALVQVFQQVGEQFHQVARHYEDTAQSVAASGILAWHKPGPA